MSTIAVITPTLPERRLMLMENMASVYNQTLKPTEHLIGIDYEKVGPVYIRNKLAFATKCEWLAFLDDDDLMMPRHLELLAAASRDQDVVWSESQVWGRPGFNVKHICSTKALDAGNHIPITVLVRKSSFVDAGGFPEVPYSEDWELWKTLRDKGAGFACVHETTWIYRWWGGNRTTA